MKFFKYLVLTVVSVFVFLFVLGWFGLLPQDPNYGLCKLDGCSKEVNGWEKSSGEYVKFGMVVRVGNKGDFCSREHGIKHLSK